MGEDGTPHTHSMRSHSALVEGSSKSHVTEEGADGDPDRWTLTACAKWCFFKREDKEIRPQSVVCGLMSPDVSSFHPFFRLQRQYTHEPTLLASSLNHFISVRSETTAILFCSPKLHI